MLASLVGKLDALFEQIKPNCVIAQGDTTSVLAASLVAFYRQIPFVHVEAGLRTTRYVRAVPGGIPSPLDRGGDVPALRADHGGGRASAKRKYPDRAHPGLRQHRDRCAARDRGGKSAAAAPIFRTSPVRSCSPRIGARIAMDVCAMLSRASANLSMRMRTPPCSFPVHVNPAARALAHEMLSDHPRIVLSEPVSYPRDCRRHAARLARPDR